MMPCGKKFPLWTANQTKVYLFSCMKQNGHTDECGIEIENAITGSLEEVVVARRGEDNCEHNYMDRIFYGVNFKLCTKCTQAFRHKK